MKFRGDQIKRMRKISNYDIRAYKELSQTLVRKILSIQHRSEKKGIECNRQQQLDMADLLLDTLEGEMKCPICNKQMTIHGTGNKGTALSLDHIIPLSAGGTNNKDNFQVICFECNRNYVNNLDEIIELRKSGEFREKITRIKNILMIDIYTNEVIKEFETISDAADYLLEHGYEDKKKPSLQGQITNCCKGRIKTSCGYVWKIKEEE